MDKDQAYVIALLERIAYQTANTPLEFEAYLDEKVKKKPRKKVRKNANNKT